jgi:cobalt/nickel transport system permease protein
MHIPDGFLSTPVWLSLDAAAALAVGAVCKRAERDLEPGSASRLGVLGAFIFAAQMINFPVAAGTSSHLIGGALLTGALGPTAASLVLTAILAIQALVFQDGGLLALGANVTNMALAGVFAAWIPLRNLRGGPGLFLAGAASVFAASSLAIVELRLSGIAMSPAILRTSLAVFLISALMEGLITMAVMGAILRMNPGWAGAPRPQGERRVLGVLGVAAVVLGSAGALLASSLPDGLEKMAEHLGISGRARSLLVSPFPDYEWQTGANPVAGKILAGLAGLIIVYSACRWAGQLLARRVSRAK